MGLWVFRERERQDSGLIRCHEKIGHTVWLIVVMTFEVAVAADGERCEELGMEMFPRDQPPAVLSVFIFVTVPASFLFFSIKLSRFPRWPKLSQVFAENMDPVILQTCSNITPLVCVRACVLRL